MDKNQMMDQIQTDIMENNLATQHPYTGMPPYCIHCKHEARSVHHEHNHSIRCIWLLAYKRRNRGEFVYLRSWVK